MDRKFKRKTIMNTLMCIIFLIGWCGSIISIPQWHHYSERADLATRSAAYYLERDGWNVVEDDDYIRNRDKALNAMDKADTYKTISIISIILLATGVVWLVVIMTPVVNILITKRKNSI